MPTASHRERLADHTRYLMAYARRKVNDRALAEDLVQDTLLAALEPENGFANRSSLRTWLTGILKHKIIDAFRERAYQPVSVEELSKPGEPGADATLVAETDHFDFGGDPHKQLEQKRFWQAIQRELARMPARTAEVFLLSEFTNTSTDKACEQLGVTPGALWVMRCRARNTLRKALGPALAA
jgi:RNA polymerase sigma-70 factor (ECF subfamily)